ncbi:hypothetical protein Acsp04_43160 [Actinomadura sp. NBRC 104425]|uniref:hypothetical protein n=1 Tax=Actinomadura sp. NBRC 104425 TaxID=3032204 RepID=UPI0024A02EEB|nr:hypothetical protein [Actinomadura sp. NBRC 104425]GLZ14081.1 hypothetical protein Acsp04_43160 [Actinomadura sp. NBRC 104425]
MRYVEIEALGNGRALGLTVAQGRVPGLRMEVAHPRRMLLRQGRDAVLLGLVDEDRYGVRVLRTGRYASPLPPLRAAEARVREYRDWAYRFAAWLDEADTSPLHEGRWVLRMFNTSVWEPLSWWWGWGLVGAEPEPSAYVDWLGNGWGGVLPLRPLSPPDAGRVKAYRKLVRERVLPPVLLWAVSGLDGHVVLDGHDRLAAALAEQVTPPMLVLTRGIDAAAQRAVLDAVEGHVTGIIEKLRRRPEPGAQRQIDALVQGLARTAAAVPYDEERTRAWPLKGGAGAWDAEAAAHGWR